MIKILTSKGVRPRRHEGGENLWFLVDVICEQLLSEKYKISFEAVSITIYEYELFSVFVLLAFWASTYPVSDF